MENPIHQFLVQIPQNTPALSIASSKNYSMILLQREIHTEKNSFLRKLVFLGYVQASSFVLCFTQARKSRRNLTTE